MPSLVGLVTLTGIVMNDSILLVSFSKERHVNGVPMLDVAQAAVCDR